MFGYLDERNEPLKPFVGTEAAVLIPGKVQRRKGSEIETFRVLANGVMTQDANA